MVRVLKFYKEDSGDEDQSISDFNARNEGDDDQEINPTTKEEDGRDLMMELRKLNAWSM